jgi:hypothetical protein
MSWGAQNRSKDAKTPSASRKNLNWIVAQSSHTGCRVHPGCTKVIATTIDRDVEYTDSRGAEPWCLGPTKRLHRKVL